MGQWNRMVAAPASSLLRVALTDNANNPRTAPSDKVACSITSSGLPHGVDPCQILVWVTQGRLSVSPAYVWGTGGI
jgi:hypothetical protein